MEMVGGTLERLRTGWHALAGARGAPGAEAAAAFADLAARYSEPTRHYHDLQHLEEVLDTVGRFQDQARDSAALGLAAWYHDAVYDTRAHDNEEKSAAFARAAEIAASATPR